MFDQVQKLGNRAWRLGIFFLLASNLLPPNAAVSAGEFGRWAETPCDLPQATTTDAPARLMGTLQDSDSPIDDADIYLQYFADEKCAKLFAKKVNPYDQKAVNETRHRLEECSHDLDPIKPDGQGHYQFDGIKPGWYAMRFLWNIHQKPKHSMAYLEQNGFAVGYYSGKDLQKKYDAMAQGTPFQFSGKKDVVVNYNGKSR